jgi:hypothetical protein
MNNKFKNSVRKIAKENGFSVCFSEKGTNLTRLHFHCELPEVAFTYTFPLFVHDNSPLDFLNALHVFCQDFDPEEMTGIETNGYGYYPLKEYTAVAAKLAALENAFKNHSSFLVQSARHKVEVIVTEYRRKTIVVDAINETDAELKVMNLIDQDSVEFKDAPTFDISISKQK